MGVPAFFRWLTVRYPKVVIDALTEDDIEFLEEEFSNTTKGEDPNELNLDTQIKMASKMNEIDMKRKIIAQKINENNPVIDNLYLDMNGIIHPCAHP